MVFAGPIISAFTNVPEVYDLSKWALRVACAAIPLIGAPIMSTTYFQAIGRAKAAILLSIMRQALILIPLIYILPRFFGVRSIWFAGPVSDALSACVSMTVIFFEIRRLRRMQDFPT